MARRTRVRRAGTAMVLLCALLAGSACTGGGDDGSDGKRAAAVQPPELKQVWETPVSTAGGFDGEQSRIVWTGSGGVVVTWDETDLRGYDSRSGKKLWTLGLPEGTSGICGMSDEVNGAGLGGLYFNAGDTGDSAEGGEQSETTCTVAGAVDIKDGEVKWAERVGQLDGPYAANGLSIGDEALTVTLHCSAVKQFRPRDGKALGARLTEDKACAHDADHNGRHLAVREAPWRGGKKGESGRDGVTSSFALYEGADTKPVWRTRAAARSGDELHGIVSDDPLVLDISRQGHRLLQTYDGDGKPVRTIGKQLDHHAQNNAPLDAGPFTTEDTLVMKYQGDPALYAYDLDTGKVRWTKRTDVGQVLGVRKNRLLALRQVVGPGGRHVPWLVSYGVRDGKERTAGRAPDLDMNALASAAWDDGRIYVNRRDPDKGTSGIAAYALPASGGDTRTYQAKAVPPPAAETGRGWRKGDLRSRRVTNACEAVSPAALKAMRVYRKGTPPPADCSWEENYAPDHARRSLDVRVVSYQPGGDEDGTAGSSTRGPLRPAVKVAEGAFDSVGDGSDDDVEDKAFTGAHRVKGLGDEAKAAVFGSVAGGMSTVKLLVRYRNVTVRVAARTDATWEDLEGEVPPRHRVEAAARLAAADVLAQLGAEVPASERQLAAPVGGDGTKVQPVCSRLRSQAAGLVPGAGAQDITPEGGADGRIAGCYWESDESPSAMLTVRAYVAPDSPLTGEKAKKRAAIEANKAGRAAGFGDQARLVRETDRSDGDVNREHTLAVRKGDLVVTVDYDRWGNPSAAGMDDDVKRVARRVLDAY